MPGAAVLAVQHLKISNLIYLGFFFLNMSFSIFIGQKLVSSTS